MPVIRKGEGAASLPEGSGITAWGVADFKAGEECDYHYHDCDEFWFLLQGRMAVIENGKEDVLEQGDTLYTPRGLEHSLRAITDTVHFWCALELKGEKRAGHLHREG